MKSRIYILILVFSLVLLEPAVAVSTLIVPLSDPKLKGIAATTTTTRPTYFNCEFSDEGDMPCTPSLNSVTGYKTEGIAVPIFTSFTKESNFDKGKFGSALHFTSGLGEYVGLQNKSFLRLDKFSVSFWVKEPSWFTGDSPIISNINLDRTAGWIFDVVDEAKKIRFGLGTTSGLVSPSPVGLGNFDFVNIVGTFDGSHIKLYENGLLAGNSRINGTYNPDPQVNLKLGLDSFDTQSAWAGSIDDLRIFNRAITESEIKQIYTNSSSITNGLIGHWPFDGNLNDFSDNRNNAVLNFQTSSMTFAPDGRMFFSEKRTGEVKIMKDDHLFSTPFVKISDLYDRDHEGLLGITLDPEFQSNHYVYVYCTQLENKTEKPINSVIRFTDMNSRGVNMTKIVDKIPADPGGDYSGGALAFGRDDKLYVTVGIANHPELAENKSSLLGKVLRVNRDGTVPSDNPFPGSPVFTVGNRNPYGIAFDANGMGIITDNGYSNYDEVNILSKGGDYGFPTYQIPSFSLLNSSFISPVRSYYDVVAPTQALFYVGEKYPALYGNFVIGSYNNRKDDPIHVLSISKDNNSVVEEMAIVFPTLPKDNIIAVAQSSSGDLYFAGFNIYKTISINSARQQIVFPIKVVSNGINITGMRVLHNNGTIVAKYDNASIRKGQPNDLQFQIPKNLLGDINLVSAGEQGQMFTKHRDNSENTKLTYSLQLQTFSTIVTIRISEPTSEVVIHGTKVLSHLVHNPNQ